MSGFKVQKNFYTALGILLTIFINPYELELKKEQKCFVFDLEG